MAARIANFGRTLAIAIATIEIDSPAKVDRVDVRISAVEISTIEMARKTPIRDRFR
jgi:hypothetical protein